MRQRSVAVSRVRCRCGDPGAAPVLSRLPAVVFLSFFFLRFRFKWKQGTVRSGLITVLRTGRSDRGSHGFMFFSHRAVLDAKRTVKMNGLRVFRSDRTVRSGFQNLNKMRIKFSIFLRRNNVTQPLGVTIGAFLLGNVGLSHSYYGPE